MAASPETQAPPDTAPALDYDAIIIGAGMSGMYQLYRLRELGMRVRVFEAGTGVGGTWYWNRYPGARFDSESYSYGYSFSTELLEEWSWSEHFAGQPETLRYLNLVADKFDLRRDVQFRSTVTAAIYDEQTRCWNVTLADDSRFRTRFLITAIGPLSTPTMPRIEGVDTFQAQSFHTARWPHEPVGFTGQRVAVIGTGATGVQTIQTIAKSVGHLTVFQRTPNWCAPLHNSKIDAETQRQIKSGYPEMFRRCQETFACFLHTPDPRGTFYYEAYNRDNVELVDITETPIERIKPDGIKTSDREYEFDIIIYATGFDAITGSFDRIDFRGVNGARLKDKWKSGPQTFLGVLVDDFPNMMMLMGPHTALGNIPRSIEYNVDWVTGLIRHARENNLTRVEATATGVTTWTDHVKALGVGLLSNEVNSWMTGINSNVDGKQTRIVARYSGSAPAYRARCDEVAASRYQELALT